MKQISTLFIIVLLISLSANLFSQTGSSCNNAITAVTGSTNSYSNSGSLPVWYQYTATKDTRIEITTCGFAYPLYLTAYNSCNPTDSVETFHQSCPASSVDRDKAFFYAKANTTYYIQWRNPTGGNNISFLWNLTEATLSPGEICSTALPLAIGTNNTGGSYLRWFSYNTAGSSAEKIVVSSCGTNSFYSQIRFDCGENDFERSAKHGQCGASTTTQFEALPGTTYYLKVYPSDNSTFNVAKSVPVTGEVCSNPFTAVLGVNHADHSNNTDQWYIFTPSQSGQLTFSNLPFGGDYELRLYNNCSSTAFAVITQQSDVSVNVTANQPLYILLREKVTMVYDWTLSFPSTATNLALNKPATASSLETSALLANNVNDGNTSTRWSSLFTDPQWVMIDLQNTYNINKVLLNWETAAGKAYQIQVSTDGSSWTPIYTTSTGAGGIETLNISGTGRYIRMYGTARTTVYGYSLWEFEVYGTPGTNIPVTGVSVSPATASMVAGTSSQLTATVVPSNATNKTVTWASGNTAVATVNSTGLVTGVAAGSATITITTQDGTKTATCAVTVSAASVPVTGVTLNPTTASIASGATIQLTATVAPTNATNKTVTWASGNTAVATVSSNGLVTGVAAGSATITVTTQDGAKTATCVVTVTSNTTNIALNKPATASSLETSALLANNVNDGNTSTRWSSLFTDPQWVMIDLQNTYNINKVLLNWETAAGKAYQIQVSTDGSSWTPIYTTSTGTGGIETLNISGTGRYIRMYGTARTTVWGYSLWEFEVYGTPGTNVPVTGVSVSPANASMVAGTSSQLTATVVPSNATNKTVTWASGNTAVATVNSTGLVTGVAAGSATITVTTQDGAKTATCAVTVSAASVPVTGVTLSATTASIASGATIQLTATVAPTNATNKTVTWASGNTAVASVSSTGLVTGVAAGTATITVTTQDGAKTATCVVTVTSNTTNIALNKPATASSLETSALLANNVNDGNTSTRWSSLFTDPQWVMIDLQNTYNINKVVLNWETAAGKAYQIQVSADGSSWGPIYTTTAGAGGIETLNILGTGRYIRMYGTARTTVWGYSLWEFEVYGTPTGTNQPPVANPGNDTAIILPVNSLTLNGSASNDPDGSIVSYAWSQILGPNTATLANANTSMVSVSNLIVGTYTFNLTVTDNLGLTASKNVNVIVSNSVAVNIALNKPASASSLESSDFVAQNVNDGNTSTRWSSQFSDPQWILIDLQAIYNITSVVLKWETAAGKAYNIEVSNNDTTFTVIKSVTNGVGGTETWNFQGVSGRYIRMSGSARTTVWGYSLWEFEVYGTFKSIKSAGESETIPATSDITVYPNPFSNQITLSLGGTNLYQWAKIFDMNGKLLISWPLAPDENEATKDLSSLSSGFYILKLEGTGKTKTLSIIKH